ncbi:hypothetical protein BD289DRAFT_430542 [Coniella lustricola]|uniref:Short-chain dehydrogenase n=1 Tax=Coniella lustricola TaxID=2025994 RepID=A0A2T3ABT9_9PEZI|nr:hypothetical protein BD289DRAFT_430542 [Coniella lustricola]
MGHIFSQFFFVPAPAINETNCPDQSGRVFIVTGGYVGVGFELCKILYAHNARVWVAGRSAEKGQRAVTTIKEASPRSEGHVEFLQLDLADLSTIKPAVQSFLAQEQRLDVLVNNAGVMFPPAGSLDAHGNDLSMGTNCLGHYLLYQQLKDTLTKTAASSPTGSVRVAWAASLAVQLGAPQPHGIVINSDGSPQDKGPQINYAQTKVGNVFLGREFAKTTPENGIVHVSFNPGNLHTELQRHWHGVVPWVVRNFITYAPIFGAYTELWAALSPEVTPAKSGAYVYPWGRFGPLPAGIEAAMKEESEGGTGVATKWIGWCRKQTEAFA